MKHLITHWKKFMKEHNEDELTQYKRELHVYITPTFSDFMEWLTENYKEEKK